MPERYEKTFQEICDELPGLLNDLEASRQRKISVREITDVKYLRDMAARFGKTADFAGCYLFSLNDLPQYVGISSHILQRLKQHVKRSTKNEATLAARLARSGMEADKTWKSAEHDQIFARLMKEKREHIADMTVAAVQIDNHELLYVFEVYASLALSTHILNSFAPH